MTTFEAPDYIIGNSATITASLSSVLTQLDQALQALEVAPNATTVKFNDTILLDDGTTTTTTITNNQTQIIDTIVGTSINQITSDVNGGGASVLVGASDLVSLTGQFIRIEAPIGSDAVIEHQEVGTTNTRNLGISSTGRITIAGDNIDLSSTGRLIVPSLASADYLDYNAGTLNLKSDNVGYTTDRMLLLENTNATAGNTTGVPTFEFYKSGRNGAITDVVSSIQFNAKDGAGVKRTFGKIESTITTNTAPANYDGALDFYSLINGVNNLVFRLNGADNENNSFRPLDLNGNVLKTSAGDLTIDATASSGTGDILLNPKVATGYIKASKEILTDSIIATQSGYPLNVGSSLNFYPAGADYKFTIDSTKLELHYNNLTTNSYQTIFQNNSLGVEEAYFKQTFNDTTTGNTIETIIENDATHHRIKLSETASGANTEITKDEINVDDGLGNVAKLTATDLQFNFVSIRPIRSYNSSIFFNVSGSPTGNIFNVGALADMVASTIWKVDVAFYTTTLNTDNIITYVVADTTPQYVEQNSVFGYSQAGFQNAQEYKSSGTTMSLYCSFTDTFEINGLASGACSFILTGGTSNGSFWTGTCNISIVLTRLQ